MDVQRRRLSLQRLDDLITRLDDKARALLASDANLGAVEAGEPGTVDIPLDADKKATDEMKALARTLMSRTAEPEAEEE